LKSLVELFERRAQAQAGKEGKTIVELFFHLYPLLSVDRARVFHDVAHHTGFKRDDAQRVTDDAGHLSGVRRIRLIEVVIIVEIGLKSQFRQFEFIRDRGIHFMPFDVVLGFAQRPAAPQREGNPAVRQPGGGLQDRRLIDGHSAPEIVVGAGQLHTAAPLGFGFRRVGFNRCGQCR